MRRENERNKTDESLGITRSDDSGINDPEALIRTTKENADEDEAVDATDADSPPQHSTKKRFLKHVAIAYLDVLTLGVFYFIRRYWAENWQEEAPPTSLAPNGSDEPQSATERHRKNVEALLEELVRANGWGLADTASMIGTVVGVFASIATILALILPFVLSGGESNAVTSIPSPTGITTLSPSIAPTRAPILLTRPTLDALTAKPPTVQPPMQSFTTPTI